MSAVGDDLPVGATSCAIYHPSTYIYIHCSEDLHVLMFTAQTILYFIATAQKIHFILLQFLLLQSTSYMDAQEERHSMQPLWSSAECLSWSASVCLPSGVLSW